MENRLYKKRPVYNRRSNIKGSTQWSTLQIVIDSSELAHLYCNNIENGRNMMIINTDLESSHTFINILASRSIVRAEGRVLSLMVKYNLIDINTPTDQTEHPLESILEQAKTQELTDNELSSTNQELENILKLRPKFIFNKSNITKAIYQQIQIAMAITGKDDLMDGIGNRAYKLSEILSKGVLRLSTLDILAKYLTRHNIKRDPDLCAVYKKAFLKDANWLLTEPEKYPGVAKLVILNPEKFDIEQKKYELYIKFWSKDSNCKKYVELAEECSPTWETSEEIIPQKPKPTKNKQPAAKKTAANAKAPADTFFPFLQDTVKDLYSEMEHPIYEAIQNGDISNARKMLWKQRSISSPSKTSTLGLAVSMNFPTVVSLILDLYPNTKLTKEDNRHILSTKPIVDESIVTALGNDAEIFTQITYADIEPGEAGPSTGKRTEPRVIEFYDENIRQAYEDLQNDHNEKDVVQARITDWTNKVIGNVKKLTCIPNFNIYRLRSSDMSRIYYLQIGNKTTILDIEPNKNYQSIKQATVNKLIAKAKEVWKK